MATILIVDDKPINREFLTSLLRYNNHRLLEASDGALALETIRKEHPDLVITDILMPILDGYQLVREIRMDPSIASTRIMFYTALYHQQESETLKKLGGVLQIKKPSDPETIVQAVNKALAIPAIITPPASLEEFDQSHLRLLADKLASKVAELELAYQKVETELKYRKLLESAFDAIVLVNSDGRINFVNSQVSNWFGYKSEEILGRPSEIFVPERFRAVYLHHQKEYLAHPVARSVGGAGIELWASRKDGTEFPVEISLTPLHTDKGLLVSAVIRDITPLKREIEIRENVLAIVSHDLKTPVTAIKSGIEIIKKVASACQNSSVIRSIVSSLEKSVNQMQHLIGDLLDVAKIHTGSLRIQIRQVSVDHLLTDLLHLVEYSAREKSINLQINVPEDLPLIECDPDRIIQVLSNLVVNAIKFTPEQGRIFVSARLVDDGVQFSVTDTGPGISKEQISHIFEHYWQARKTAHLGAGLGLSIAKGLVDAHRGKIWVESQLKHGSTFSFIIPIHTRNT